VSCRAIRQPRSDASRPLETADATAITFLAQPKLRSLLEATQAGAVILGAALVPAAPEGCQLIVTDDPYLYFARLTQWWAARVRPLPAAGVHPSAVIEPGAVVAASATIGPLAVIGAGAVIGERARIGAHCAIGARARIGDDTLLHPRVTIGTDCSLGARCVIQSGAVIGADGFGIAPSQGRWERIEQLGAVRIGDDVDIGANTCIDRGALEDTVLEDGVKLDNQIQIGHNCHIGAHTVMAACVGIAGKHEDRSQRDDRWRRDDQWPHRDRRWRDGIGLHDGDAFASQEGCLHGHLPGGRSRQLGKERGDPAQPVRAARARSRPREEKLRHHVDVGHPPDPEEAAPPLSVLLVDRVVEFEKDVRIKALKNVTINEPFFVGHFPSRPVMPGVMMLEALAQASATALVLVEDKEAERDTLYYFVGIDWCTLQARRRARRPARARVAHRARPRGHLQVRRTRDGRPGAGRRGDADVHRTQDRGLIQTTATSLEKAMTQIHSTALVDPAAELDPSVTVGPYAVIGPHVRIGAGTSVGPHCVIEGRTTIGRDNRFYQFSSIGAMPQDMSHRGEPTELRIGDRNTVREFCTLNTGTLKEEGVTRVGSDNWIMAYVHVAHDVRLGDHTVLANGVTLAGHVHIGDWAVVGGLSGVHQFVHIGAHAMIGFQAHVAQDVPPFMTAEGNPARAAHAQPDGLKRRDFSAERIAAIKQMHRSLYRKGLTLEQAKAEIDALRSGDPAAATPTCADARASSHRSTRGHRPIGSRWPDDRVLPRRRARRRTRPCALAWWPAKPPATCWPACCCRACDRAGPRSMAAGIGGPA
jgi:UDP-N-acetylglucosamine acyltransferase